MYGERWRKARDLLGPGIYTAAVATYEPRVQASARHAVDHIESHVNDLDAWSRLAVFDMFTSLALGKSPNAVDPACSSPLRELVGLDAQTVDLSIRLHYTPWFARPRNGFEKMSKAYDRIYELVRPEIDELVADDRRETCWVRDLHERQGLNEEQLAHVMMMMLSGAVGTTKGVVQWMITAIPYYPEVQRRLREEIRTNLGEKPYTKAVKMEYLDAVIRETTRVFSPVPTHGDRTLPHDLDLPSSRVRVPAGTKIVLAPLYEARDTELASNADIYMPERFLRENIRSRRKSCPHGPPKFDASIIRDPFGNGAHVCLVKRAAELEVRTITCELLKRFELVLDPPGQPFPEAVPRPILMPEPMPKVKLVPLQ